MIAEADKYRQDDERRRSVRQFQNRLEGLLYTNERVVREFGSSLDPTEIGNHVRSTLNRARKALTSEERSVLEEAILCGPGGRSDPHRGRDGEPARRSRG